MRSWRAIAAAVIALALAVVAAVPAVAGQTFSVSVQMASGPPAFHGSVASENDFCVANRPVKIKRVVRHKRDPTVASGNTDANGAWKIKVKNIKTHAYYARAPVYGSASLGIQCAAAKSQVQAAD